MSDNTTSSDVLQLLNKLSDEDRHFIGRIMRGEADRDQIQRGLVHAAIRSLRTNPVPTREYQKALADMQRLVSKIDATPMPVVQGAEAGGARLNQAATPIAAEVIDWSMPLEAFHDDGRVVPAKFLCHASGHTADVRFEGRHENALKPSGYVGHGWRIRNIRNALTARALGQVSLAGHQA